jgi:hypothetical protein
MWEEKNRFSYSSLDLPASSKFLVGFVFDPEDKGDMSLLNIG